MYIKNIILEGFKSYARQTVVGPFDPHFNAITGLNGTGKSNILDAICFVLGISSLSTVRAAKLEDLISKNAKGKGEIGGASTAKVAIVFDNTNKTPGSCPLGYENRDEIIVSRTIEYKKDNIEIDSKYHLNGKVVPKNIVVDLFGSVRLDVNNPNFMIMQGKITKVVNMKPKELLQMIEETVGATIYENKRGRAISALEGSCRSKETLQTTMNDTILPALESQRIAKKHATDYEALLARIKVVDEKYAIKMYLYLVDHVNEAARKKDEIFQRQEAEHQQKRKLESNIENLKKEQEDLKAKAANQTNVKAAEKEISQLSKECIKEDAKVDSARRNKSESSKRLKEAREEYDKEQRQIEQFKNQQQGLIEEFNTCQSVIAQAERGIAESEEKLEKIKYGNILDESGRTVNIQEQISGIQQEIREKKGPWDIKQKELKHDATTIKEKETKLRNTPTDEQLERDYHNARNRLKSLEDTLKRANIDPSQTLNLGTTIFETERLINQKQREQERCYNKNRYLRFSYNKPNPSFDDRNVHGQVYELFEVTEMDKFKVALEVHAQGYFTQVVVENPEISKLLITHGRLQNRTTFIPLSAIKGYSANHTQQQFDKKFGVNKAVFAINLIRYDEKHRRLMEMIFGRLVICDNMKIAKEVAYNFNYKSVTLEGDVVENSGIMQGGHRQSAGDLLTNCQELRQLKLDLIKLQKDFHDLKIKNDMCKRNEKIVQEHKEAQRHLQSCKDLLELTAYSRLYSELQDLKQQYEDNVKFVQSTKKEIDELVKKEHSLKLKQKNEEQLLEKSRKDVDVQLNKWKRQLEQAKKQKASKDKLYKDIDYDLKAKDQILKDCEKAINEAVETDNVCQLALAKQEQESQRITEEYRRKIEKCNATIRASKEFEKKIDRIEDDINKIDRKIHELDLSKMKITTQLKQQTERFQNLKNQLDSFIDEHPDVEFQENMQPTTSRSVKDLKKELDDLNSKKEHMRARLNMKAVEALPRTEDGVKKSKYMLACIQQSIQIQREVLQILDDHKMNLVQTAYERVNTEFGFMMSTLLPGSHAKLVPVNPRSLTDGVIIHVRLGGVWKESLTELSGGQRSLVALSLVLSLCMYNPSPFYVLDEIDSALDLNHTSNIGYLIKSKFTNVQFICVSLKDGMFNNADVIFRTKFENGTSAVSCSRKSNKIRQNEGEMGQGSSKSKHHH